MLESIGRKVKRIIEVVAGRNTDDAEDGGERMAHNRRYMATAGRKHGRSDYFPVKTRFT